jgi:hypothetical protein
MTLAEDKSETSKESKEQSSSAQKPSAKRPRKKSSEQSKALLKDVLVRLQGLRSVAKEISRSYLANLEHGILEITDLVNGTADEGGKKKGLKSTTLERLVDILENTSLKPEKGRRKDLKRIDQAIEAMMGIASKKKR